jgi:hypothetical protein
MTPERRRHIRVPGPFAGRIESKHARIELRDLGEGGCFIHWTSEAPKPREQFELTIEPEGETSIIVTVETVYAHPGIGFGVLFRHTSDDAYAKVERLVERLRQRTSW